MIHVKTLDGDIYIYIYVYSLMHVVYVCFTHVATSASLLWDCSFVHARGLR